jgi:tripartite-type tricarboxylate transporter receptor subunit TctC
MTLHLSSRRKLLQQGAGAAAATGLLAWGISRPAWAQAPLEQLIVLCTGPAGSIPDTLARRVAEQLGGRHAQRAIVDNRPGAAGQIAVNALKAAPADGSTVLLAQGAIATVYPALYAKLQFDPAVDLRPVSLAGEMTLGLAVGPAVPETVVNVQQLVAWMRLNPKLANVGSPGTGTLPHLLEAMLFRAAGLEWQHVGYPGGPPALVDLIGGQIAALVLPEGLLRQHRAAGRLRVLATSGAQRSAYLPDVSSLVEQGYPDLVVREWFAFFMSGRVPPAVVESTSQALRLAIGQPVLSAAFSDLGMVAASSTPAALASRIAVEQRYWEPVIRTANIRAE